MLPDSIDIAPTPGAGNGYRARGRDAEAASNAVHTLEAHTPPIEGIDDDDSRYDASWYRQTSIWDKWAPDRTEEGRKA